MDSFVSFVYWKTLANPFPRSRLNTWHSSSLGKQTFVICLISANHEKQVHLRMILFYGMNSRSKGVPRTAWLSTNRENLPTLLSYDSQQHWACLMTWAWWLFFKLISGISKVQDLKPTNSQRTEKKRKQSWEICEELVHLSSGREVITRAPADWLIGWWARNVFLTGQRFSILK